MKTTSKIVWRAIQYHNMNVVKLCEWLIFGTVFLKTVTKEISVGKGNVLVIVHLINSNVLYIYPIFQDNNAMVCLYSKYIYFETIMLGSLTEFNSSPQMCYIDINCLKYAISKIRCTQILKYIPMKK